jgi:hypothetical protein
VARARRRWMREQGIFDPAHLVFIDETAANTKMLRLYGRCRRGERLIDRAPQGRWKTITFVAALRRPGAYGTNSAEQIAAQTTCPRGLEYGGLFAWSLRMEQSG